MNLGLKDRSVGYGNCEVIQNLKPSTHPKYDIHRFIQNMTTLKTSLHINQGCVTMIASFLHHALTTSVNVTNSKNLP
jgi:hypothetical protein